MADATGHDLAGLAQPMLEEGDIVLTLGAGDILRAGEQLLSALGVVTK